MHHVIWLSSIWCEAAVRQNTTPERLFQLKQDPSGQVTGTLQYFEKIWLTTTGELGQGKLQKGNIHKKDPISTAISPRDACGASIFSGHQAEAVVDNLNHESPPQVSSAEPESCHKVVVTINSAKWKCMQVAMRVCFVLWCGDLQYRGSENGLTIVYCGDGPR